MNSLFYNKIEKNDMNSDVIEKIEKYVNSSLKDKLYLINAPLGKNKYSYDYQDKVIVILSPKHKIIFLDLANEEEFRDYFEDFIEDLGSISDKFDYKEYIGRPREWRKQKLIIDKKLDSNFDIKSLLNENKIDKNLERKNELLISLLTGSINDIKNIAIDEPKSLLEKIKNKIVLFDGEQIRFLYKELNKKLIYIQGLSGSGKTELLLHKLKELYLSSEDSKIFFTCHNKVLATNLEKRVPNFFNFMKVEKQIEWGERLWVTNAWGSARNKDSGLYSYICDFYQIPFLGWNRNTNYEVIFKSALNEIEKIDKDNFEYAFDYILIDESQDFPDILFELCEKITKERVYIAGDIFQNIFENEIDKKIVNADFILKQCYRTDPRTFMFAQAIGMGLFEEKKINWLSDKEWEDIGYKLERENRNISLYREPIKRFEDLEIETISSMNLELIDGNSNNDFIFEIIDIIKNIKENNPTVKPDDIAVILLDENKYIYELANTLEYEMSKLNWRLNKGYESKEKIENTIFLSNRNNVKGLEFPFVICVTDELKKDDYTYRNTLYTMLTRSFIQSYLLIPDSKELKIQQDGLEIINKERCIKTIEPTNKEKERIKNTIIKYKEEANISYKDFLTQIFNKLNMDSRCRKKLEKNINENLQDEDKFNREFVIEYIEANIKFLCK